MERTASLNRAALTGRALLAALALWLAAGAAFAQADPPGRVADLSLRQGTVVFAPAGDDEWTELPVNRPLTQGDRLWVDRGALAELHLGAATVQMNGQTHLLLGALDDDEVQLSLTQGTLNARVRQLSPQENFEIATPNLALRATQPGDYRVDVDPQAFTTRVRVARGQALLFDARGQALRLEAGAQLTFTGQALEQVAQPPQGNDAFDVWAADRNQREDQSLAARHVPRDMVGYARLDGYGTWSQDPAYGAVWYPRQTLADWAPYRYGHWTHIAPWGWTWVDDAPWGFAPFHYGRWALIGARWGWVPGPIGPRPRYAPALVVFVDGGHAPHWGRGAGPGIAWYPLAPGEAWRPVYRASDSYIASFNRHARRDRPGDYQHRHRAEAITAVRVEDFHRGRPVREHWRSVRPAEIARAPVVTSLTALPRPGRERDRDRVERQPRLQQSPPALALAAPQRGQPLREARRERQEPPPPREPQRESRERADQAQQSSPREQVQRPLQESRQIDQARRQQERADREPDRGRRDNDERRGRELPPVVQERAEQAQQRVQREQAQRQQQHQQEQQARQQERAQRDGQRQAREQQERTEQAQQRAQREQAQRQQQHQQEQQTRQQERAQHAQERAQARQQQQAQQQQERQQRAAERAQRPAQRQEAREQARPPSRGDEDNGRGRGPRGG